MTDNVSHLHHQPEANPSTSSGGSGGGGDSPIGERIARLETRMDYLATKNDISKLKIWILGGCLAALITGAGLALGAVKLFT